MLLLLNLISVVIMAAMKVTILGITGFVGSALDAELRSRGHEVVGGARSVEPGDGRIRAVRLDDLDAVRELAAGSDAIVVATQPSVESGSFADLVPALLDVAADLGARIGFVGGAGSLLLENGERLVDQPDFPEAFRPGALAHADALDRLRSTDHAADWFVISPAQRFGRAIPGERRGTYRVGRDALLRDAEGVSQIGIADFVAALADELERPAHSRTRFTVAY